MNKLFKKLPISILVFTLLFFVITPFFVFAQINYVPLAPLPGTGAGTTCIPNQTPPDPNCNVNSISTYLPGIFKLAIEVAAALAVIMITIGGIEYIGSESISTKEAGKKKIENSLIGLLLAIGAVIILSTINPNLVSFNLSINQYTPPPPPTGGPTPPGAITCPGFGPSPWYTQYPCGSAWPDDAMERYQLTNNTGIVITGTGTSAQCTTVGQAGCTSVYGLPYQAIGGILWLNNNCSGCSITITGGTEFWPHVSHGPGIPHVDLRLSSALDAFIKNPTNSRNLGTLNTCYNGQPAWLLNGATYVLENGTHWHVCY